MFDDYGRALTDAAGRWLEANPAAPEAGAIRMSADRVRAMLAYGRDHIGFGLDLLRNPG